MIDLPEFSPSWKFCPARTSREIFCPGPPGIASLGWHMPNAKPMNSRYIEGVQRTALPTYYTHANVSHLERQKMLL